jgi:hypothetical protein
MDQKSDHKVHIPFDEIKGQVNMEENVIPRWLTEKRF